MNRYTTLLNLLLLLISFQTLFAAKPIDAIAINKAADVPLTLVAKDKSSGMQLKPKFTVIHVKTGNSLAIKEIDGQFVVNVQAGQSYKIKAELEGYYPFEKTIEIKAEIDPEGKNEILDMDPQPTAIVILRAVDDFNQPVEANFKVTSSIEPILGQVSRKQPDFRLVLTSPEAYRISVTSAQYKTQIETLDVEVSDPPKTYEKIFRLSKAGTTMRILVQAASMNTPIKNAKVVVTNIVDNFEIYQKILPDGEGGVELANQKKYKISVEADGYRKYEEELKQGSNEVIVKMVTESIVNIGTYDKTTGTRIPALVKIFFKDKQITELKTDPFSDALFYPTERGAYSIKVVSKGFKDFEGMLNIENIAGGKLPFRANLENFLEDYVVLILDEKDKQMVGGAEVVIADANGVGVPVNKNTKTNEWKVSLDKGKEYKIQVNAPGYKPFEGDLVKSKSKLVGVSLQKIMQAQYFSAIDAYTKKPLLAQYKVTRPEQEPLLGKSEAETRFMVDMKPQDTFILEVSANDYKTQSDRLSFVPNTLETNKVFELKKDSYKFSFKVIDAQTKAAIQQAQFIIQDLTNNRPLNATPSTTAGVYEVAFQPESIYNIEVSADGYDNLTNKVNALELIGNSLFTQEIPLIKDKIDAYKVIVVDAEKGTKISTAQVIIINTAKETIPVTANPLSAEWLVELNNEQNYQISIDAENYEHYEGDLVQNKDKQVTLKIKKIPTNVFTFMAIDALTKKSIAANFKVSTDGQVIETSKLADGTKAKATLISNKNYSLDISSDGYESQNIAIRQRETPGNTISVSLKKLSYDFTFRVVNSNTQKPVPNPKMVITSNGDDTPSAKYRIESGDFTASLNPERIYTINVEAAGYQSYVEKFNTASMAEQQSFKKDVFLAEVIVEKPVETPKVEAPKVEKPKVVETPKVEPPKPEPKKPEVVETPKPIKVEAKTPAPTPNITSEKPVVGKKYQLGNVMFEQSSPQLKPESYHQLDELAALLKTNPNIKIDIIGHTDNVGEYKLNQYLSEFRAKAIANYLYNKGIEPARIQAIGKGQTEPIAPNDTEENRKKNRRVDIIVKENVK